MAMKDTRTIMRRMRIGSVDRPYTTNGILISPWTNCTLLREYAIDVLRHQSHKSCFSTFDCILGSMSSLFFFFSGFPVCSSNDGSEQNRQMNDWTEKVKYTHTKTLTRQTQSQRENGTQNKSINSMAFDLLETHNSFLIRFNWICFFRLENSSSLRFDLKNSLCLWLTFYGTLWFCISFLVRQKQFLFSTFNDLSARKSIVKFTCTTNRGLTYSVLR